MQRNSNADMTLSLRVREIAIIEPVAAGVQRSSAVAPPLVVPIHVPEIQPTCAIVAFALSIGAVSGKAAAVVFL